MKVGKPFGSILVVGVLLGLMLPTLTASAHTGFPEGPYTVEIGWLNEPPVVGQPNAIVVNLSAGSMGSGGKGTPEATTSASSSKIDYTGLTLEVSYGGQTKKLDLVPQSEDTPYDLMGVMTPSVMGKYTVLVNGKLTGDLGSANVAINMQPEEVVGINAVQFPDLSEGHSGQDTANSTTPLWLPIAALAAGVIGIILAVIALFRK